MPRCLVCFGLLKPFTLFGDTMQNLGTFDFLQIPQQLYQMVHIVSVHRAEVTQPHRFKQIAPFKQHRLYTVVDILHKVTHLGTDAVEFAQHIPDIVFDSIVSLGRGNIQQILTQPACIGVDGHVIIVEDNQKIGIVDTGIVQSFKCHSARHGTVTDNGYGLAVFLSVELGCQGHA